MRRIERHDLANTDISTLALRASFQSPKAGFDGCGSDQCAAMNARVSVSTRS